MKHPTIITTIHAKTKGMDLFERLAARHLVVVGDCKTPAYQSTDRLTWLSIEDQGRMKLRLAEKLPFNHYCRKNLGYLWAISQGAETIYDTDDDNLPYDDWEFPDFRCTSRSASTLRFANVYTYFTNELIWPRGYPLDEIQNGDRAAVEPSPPVRVGVWQGLADGDPDVDAIFRLLYTRETRFARREPFVLRRGQFCPFNSQNTLWTPEAFAYLYLPVTVSFRFTDILRGYVAQRGLWEHGLHLGFTRATVYQERNAHDLMRDFRDEVECYQSAKAIVDVLESLALGSCAMDNLWRMYVALVAKGLVRDDELGYVAAWAEDVAVLPCPRPMIAARDGMVLES